MWGPSQTSNTILGAGSPADGGGEDAHHEHLERARERDGHEGAQEAAAPATSAKMTSACEVRVSRLSTLGAMKFDSSCCSRVYSPMAIAALAGDWAKATSATTAPTRIGPT